MIFGTVTRLTWKAAKLARILRARDPLWLRALRHGVAAGVEHVPMLRTIRPAAVVDIGANRGQFALAIKHVHPDAQIVAFEPLQSAASIWQRIFAEVDGVVLHQCAIGPDPGTATMFVTAEDDCSSLLEPTQRQKELASGSRVVRRVEVPLCRLEDTVDLDTLPAPILLKVDVQGGEREVLKASRLDHPGWRWIYVEASFVELYHRQALATDIIEALMSAGYHLAGLFNPWTSHNSCQQADFLFARR